MNIHSKITMIFCREQLMDFSLIISLYTSNNRLLIKSIYVLTSIQKNYISAYSHAKLAVYKLISYNIYEITMEKYIKRLLIKKLYFYLKSVLKI